MSSGVLSSHLLSAFGAHRLAKRDISACVGVWDHSTCAPQALWVRSREDCLTFALRVNLMPSNLEHLRHGPSDHKALVTEILTHGNVLFTED